MRAGKDYATRIMKAAEEVDFRIAKLDLGPHDYLVVKVKGRLTMEAHAHLRDSFSQIGIKNRVLVMDDQLDLAVLTRVEAASPPAR